MANNIPGLTTTFRASGTITKRRLVAYAAALGVAVQASGPTNALAGVSADIDTADGRPADVIRQGLAPVEYGATVAAGDPLTADAQGRAVKATAGQRIAGFADVPGIVGDIGALLIAPGYAA